MIDFEYLGVNINQYTNMHNQIKLKISAVNKDYYALEKLFKSKLFSWRSKERLYLSRLRPILTYTCETWSTTKRDEGEMAFLVRKIVTRIYRAIIEKEVYNRRKNEELKQIYQKPGVNMPTSWVNDSNG